MGLRGNRMKVLLVQPTTVHLDGRPLKSKRRFIMGLMMPLLAGLTPPEVDVEACDERLEDCNFDGGYDLVGMTTTWCTDQFYSLRSIAKRLLLPPHGYTPQGLPSNLFFYWGAKKRIDPVDYY